MRSRLSLMLAASLFSTAIPAIAQDGYVKIEQRLSAEQLRATGLDGLSAEQLALLNELLQQDRQSAVQAHQKDAQTRGSGGWFGGNDAEPVTSTVTSTVAGEFRGWSSGTVLRLANGQRWQVVDGNFYLGKPLTDPKVTISPGKISGWYLRVEGQNPSAKVKRID
ncbi:hypothetical protein [Pseudoxanthomonas wuyuanensis]|uniref:Secreted protein n=1 Tax=Pseudoxanthomonas wuyuanensis TaxID=1073196 RepID=A0A286D7Y2_9GAMM|nr:hypothetical protein [Pseudoxanthomonas wuyuanensis]KAF1720344.1 hypothetical protein CSC75_11050 [Pseudoxanthomonas wuyuanensis]SOD54733.1 hypothetical protein SAMN06296416_104345 [Pseudoxanthomonas wuyuanensis]